MILRFIIIFFLILLSSCSNKEKVYEIKPKIDPYLIYEEAYEAFENGDYFFAQKKFFEAELNLDIIEHAAKASIMASYSLYSINFYDEALENIERYKKKYPADKNIIYAHYLVAIIYFEQITDEKKDMNPLIKSKDKIDYFLKNYPNSEYAIDLKFKKDLIINQMAAKELFVAKYYISTQKWIPAINRLKVIVKDYDKTVFIEEALHRLVETYYFIGLEKEAKKYASILGYNYNSSEWFKQSYKILNKDYDLFQSQKIKKENLIKRIIKKIK
tara:strand:- start:4714 stop:5529 length:816 start_codon:yes stop_codon:yes gene_type:complete